MDGGHYNGGGTRGGKCGCLLAAVVGLPLLGFSLLAGAMGDCIQGEPCNHGIIWRLIIPSLLIAALIGIGTRAFVNWLLRRRQR